MIRLNESVIIVSPPSKVFAFLADLNNISKWQTEVVKSTVVTPGPTKVGTRFTEEQRTLIQEFAKQRSLTTPRDIIQTICQEYFEAQGKIWPQDYPQWGGRRKKKQ